MAKVKSENVRSCKPLEDRVVIRRLDEGDKSKGGNIIIPEVAREYRRVAEVVATGPGIWKEGRFIEMYVKPGDIVLTDLHKGVELQWGGKDLQILRQSDIKAIVELEE